MAEQKSSEFFIDIRESYVDTKLKEFFEGTANDVNIDNICLFAAKTVEEYNQSSETKLKGKQKHEAAVDLAKRIIEKSVTFVADDQKRQTIKNLYYNIESIPQTIDFIVNISNNPNIVNAGKWVVNKIAKNVSQGGCFSRLFSLCKKGTAKKSQDQQPETELGEVNADKAEEKPKPLTKEEKRKLKMDEERKKREEKLQKELEDLRLTPEEKVARAKAAEEERKKAIEDAKKAKMEEKLAAKKAIEDKKEQKRLEKLKKKEAALKEALEKLNSQHTPKEEPAKEEAAKEESASVESASVDSVVVEETKEE